MLSRPSGLLSWWWSRSFGPPTNGSLVESLRPLPGLHSYSIQSVPTGPPPYLPTSGRRGWTQAPTPTLRLPLHGRLTYEESPSAQQPKLPPSPGSRTSTMDTYSGSLRSYPGRKSSWGSGSYCMVLAFGSCRNPRWIWWGRSPLHGTLPPCRSLGGAPKEDHLHEHQPGAS